MCDEDWINVAMSDDSVVVEILLRLHQDTPPPPPPPPSLTKKQPPCLRVDWTVRQRRSRSVPRHRGSEGKDEPTRASPTTPLSWSCATSASFGGGGGAVDGCEESSCPIKRVESSRSEKVKNPSEATSTKRSRRKKTLVELKEEENFLLRERKNLKNELASLRLTVEKHRAANKSLKRMKLDLESGKAFKTDSASVATEEEQSHSCNATSSTSLTNKVLSDAPPHICPTNPIKAQETIEQEVSFLLPDLNLPVEEDLNSNALT